MQGLKAERKTRPNRNRVLHVLAIGTKSSFAPCAPAPQPSSQTRAVCRLDPTAQSVLEKSLIRFCPANLRKCRHSSFCMMCLRLLQSSLQYSKGSCNVLYPLYLGKGATPIVKNFVFGSNCQKIIDCCCAVWLSL